jgi:predicted molibdopterin-dependent oxidoreductase YjgC
MGKVNFIIDGKDIQAEQGDTILQAARRHNIHIPILCDHPALPPEGSCRICLVEIEGQRTLHPSCTYPVTEDMVVDTDSERVRAARKFNLELLISDHPLDCMTCEAAGDCLLQDLAYDYDVKEDVFHGTRHQFSVNDPNPFIQVDRNKCILCRRCVRACQEINGVEAISVFYRGFSAYIGFGADSSMDNSPCEFCGSCVAVCPTAALWPKLSLHQGRPWQVDRVQTTCPYCGVGCQLILEVKDNKIIKVDTAWDGPSNHGWTCVKGKFGYDFVHHPDRLDKPRVRKYLLDGKKKPPAKKRQPDKKGGPWEWVEVEWEVALGITADKMVQTRDVHGPDRLGFLTSAKCLNEENYLMNKLARQAIGTNSIDHCARL